MKKQIYLAMDFGSGSGRGIAGLFDGERLRTEEISRFPNYFADVQGKFYWDHLYLYQKIIKSAEKLSFLYGEEQIQSMGIDTWGTDYGFLDKNGGILGGCRCVRNSDGSGLVAVDERIPFRELYRAVGIQQIRGNTLYQLYEQKLGNEPVLSVCRTLLMMPDLLVYCLTGEKYAEYTIASTSMMLDPFRKKWNTSLMEQLGLPKDIMPEILMSGEKVFPVRKGILNTKNKWNVAIVASHDTASAVVAAPLEKNEMFCSSGTWSMIGIEMENPVVTDLAREMNFSNEGSIDGRTRFLKNCMGMWAIQQCTAQWEAIGQKTDWAGIVLQAKKVTPFQSLVNLEEPQFYNAGDMIGKIQEFCRRTNQKIPETIGEIARCIYESVALRYRLVAEQLETVTGRKFSAFRIVGGGSQNILLNQFAANALQIPVYAGPAEAACAGNILAQVAAFGELHGLSEIRDVIKNSFEIAVYEPTQREAWEEAYKKYQVYESY